LEVRQMSDIQYYNRKNKQIEIEKVYGDGFVKLLYKNPIGKLLAPLFANKLISIFYGWTQDTKRSGKKVPGFIKKFNINLEEYQKGSFGSEKIENSYASFNEFFIRRFHYGVREIAKEASLMPAFCEARYFGHEKINGETKIPVKGKFLSSKDLIGEKYASLFEGGPLMIARLCPVDYHRYHYPDNGTTLDHYFIHGKYDSVNPMAIAAKEEIFIQNERRVSILETENFGKLAYIEVGAVCVGKIIQSHDENQAFKRGQEKGYFLFGGSTVVLLGEPGKWKPSMDILENTQKGIETYIQLGDQVAIKS
jgi:phosphatidylserine decarboxylase